MCCRELRLLKCFPFVPKYGRGQPWRQRYHDPAQTLVFMFPAPASLALSLLLIVLDAHISMRVQSSHSESQDALALTPVSLVHR